MSATDNIHDKLFRETMSRKDVAADFLRSYLPPPVLKHIDLESLRIAKDSFVSQDLRDSFSDLLYSVCFTKGRPGFIYFLFEHKSVPDRFLPLQLLRYMVDIWELHRKQNKGRGAKMLPLIVPVVVYHGKPRREAQRLAALVDMPHAVFQGYIPDFSCEFYDFSLESDQEIKGMILLQLLLASLRARNDPENAQHVLEIFKLLDKLDESESSLRWVQVIFRYLAQVMDISSQEMQDIASRTLTAGKEETIMTLAERLRQDGMQEGLLLGRQEGLQEGLQEGRHEGLVEGRKAAQISLLQRLMHKRFGEAALAPELLQAYAQATPEQLELWAVRVLDAASIEEVLGG